MRIVGLRTGSNPADTNRFVVCNSLMLLAIVLYYRQLSADNMRIVGQRTGSNPADCVILLCCWLGVHWEELHTVWIIAGI